MDRQQWNERYASAPILWNVDPSPFLGGEVGDRAPGRALDLGAGEGRTTLWLAQRGWQVTAVDFSDVAIDRGRRRAEEAATAGAVEWVLCDLVDYEPPPETFDLVLFLFVHLPPEPRRRLLRLACQALVPGGTILVVGYDTTHVAERAGGPADPTVRFSPEEIVAELDGLTVERAERLEIGTAVDAVVRAVR